MFGPYVFPDFIGTIMADSLSCCSFYHHGQYLCITADIFKSNSGSFNNIQIDHPILKKHDATKSELQTELDRQNELRWQFYNAYIENHGKLLKVTTEEEWDKVIKSMNRIF